MSNEEDPAPVAPIAVPSDSGEQDVIFGPIKAYPGHRSKRGDDPGNSTRTTESDSSDVLDEAQTNQGLVWLSEVELRKRALLWQTNKRELRESPLNRAFLSVWIFLLVVVSPIMMMITMIYTAIMDPTASLPSALIYEIPFGLFFWPHLIFGIVSGWLFCCDSRFKRNWVVRVGLISGASVILLINISLTIELGPELLCAAFGATVLQLSLVFMALIIVLLPKLRRTYSIRDLFVLATCLSVLAWILSFPNGRTIAMMIAAVLYFSLLCSNIVIVPLTYIALGFSQIIPAPIPDPTQSPINRNAFAYGLLGLFASLGLSYLLAHFVVQ